MNFKQIIVAGIAGMAIQVAVATPTVSDVVARQRYPWNGMVDIDYTITGDASGLKLEIGVEDRQNGKTYTPTKFLSVLPTSAGRHRVTWSTEAEGVTIISTNVAVTVSLVQLDPAYQKKNLYYVVDLSGGPRATSYPVTTMSAPDDVVWSDEYKTTKLVLRRIEAGEIPTHACKITKPFYVGVFEVSVAQWNLVMSSDENPDAVDDRAKVLTYNNVRGGILGAGWPQSSDVDSDSFVGKLRAKTGLHFDLPTEAQWEYACRSGTSSLYNNGGSTENDLAILGRYWGNKDDGRGGYSGITAVGAYAPNLWGVYDMHGNVCEWCLDWEYDWSEREKSLTGEDPVGALFGTYRILRGGCCDQGYGRPDSCTSSSRDCWYPDETMCAKSGCRIVCPAGL